MTVKTLRQQAKSLGLKGYSRLRKAELIRLIATAQPTEKEWTVREMKAECKKRGLKGYSKLNKASLVRLLVSTNNLATTKKQTDEQILLATIAALPSSFEETYALARFLMGSRSAAVASVMLNRERRAYAHLRDNSETEREYQKWNGYYVAACGKVM